MKKSTLIDNGIVYVDKFVKQTSVMRTTLKDIAKYLNVSTTTVSRAINDKDDISLEMRHKVLKVAKMLDYKPNSVAISLRKKTANNLIGVIMPVVDHHFFSTILRGITTTELKDDYMILIGESNHDVDREKEIINKFGDHYVAGIIFVPSRNKNSKDNVQLLQKRQTPFILIDRTFKDFDGSFIQHDDFQGAFKATSHLLERGRRNIVLLKGSDECSVSQSRLEGYLAALKAADISYDHELVISCTNASKYEGFMAFKNILESQKRPDAIFCITDHLAAGALDFAKSKNIKVPEELSIVGYSNSEISQNVTPTLTTVAQDGYEMGRLAKEYLIEMCNHKNVSHQKVFPSHLIVRESS